MRLPGRAGDRARSSAWPSTTGRDRRDGHRRRDFRNDGELGVAIGNFANEMTSFYVAQAGRRGQFTDEAIAEGIGAPSRALL